MCCFPFVCLSMTALFHKSINKWTNGSFPRGTRGLGALLSEKQMGQWKGDTVEQPTCQ